MHVPYTLYSVKYCSSKYFMNLPILLKKNYFTNKFLWSFQPCISSLKLFIGSAKIFNLANFQLFGMCLQPPSNQSFYR